MTSESPNSVESSLAPVLRRRTILPALSPPVPGPRLHSPRTMSKKREGFQAAANLSSTTSPDVWARVEQHATSVIASIPDLHKCENATKAISEALSAGSTSLSKEQLLDIVHWKHRVGKNRVYNVKHIQANDETAVHNHTQTAMAIVHSLDATQVLDPTDGDWSADNRALASKALAELAQLRGVGPATASAILTLVRPDLFCYMYDEVIDCFEKQRDYKANQYVRINDACLRLAHQLGGEWTTSRVAKVLWVAARYMATHGQDLTQNHDHQGTEDTGKAQDDGARKELKRKRAHQNVDENDTGSGTEPSSTRPSRRTR